MNGLNIGHDALSVGQPTNPVIALIAAKRGAPIFIGIWISWVCYGTICILVPNYLFALRTNPLKERLFIIALFLINTADVALDLSRVIKIYVAHFGDALYYVNFHARIEDYILFFSSIYILLICQVYLTYRAHLFLRSVEGRLFVWRRAITLVSSALVLASATCGFIGQVELHTFPTFIAVSAATYRQYGKLYPLMRISAYSFGLAWLLPQCYLFSLELYRARAWHLRHEDDAERRLKSWWTKVYIGLRNGSPTILLQVLTLTLYFIEGKSWTSAASSSLPRLYTIFVVLWTAVPRPRKGVSSSSHTSSTIPDLSWTSSHDPTADDASVSAGCTGPLSASVGRFRLSGLFGKSGRRDWRAEHAEAKARRSRGRISQRSRGEVKTYTLDLRADEEAAGGRRSRQASLMFADDRPDDTARGYGGHLSDKKRDDDDDIADWREGISMREAQSCFTPSSATQFLPTLLRHRPSLPSSALRSTTPENDDVLPQAAPPRSSYTAPPTPASIVSPLPLPPALSNGHSKLE